MSGIRQSRSGLFGAKDWEALNKILAILACLAPMAGCRLSNMEGDFFDDREDSLLIEADCSFAKSEMLKPLVLELAGGSTARPTPKIVADMDEVERQFEDCAE